MSIRLLRDVDVGANFAFAFRPATRPIVVRRGIHKDGVEGMRTRRREPDP